MEEASLEQVREGHREFFERTPLELISMETEEIWLYPELLEQLQGYELDLDDYNQNGAEADIYVYLLEEVQTTGDEVRAVIYEIDGELFGGYGLLKENGHQGDFRLVIKAV